MYGNALCIPLGPWSVGRLRPRSVALARWPAFLAMLLAAVMAMLIAGPANAAVDVRVEARPVSAPIQTFVTVTDASGNPVGGLGAADFTVLVDGVALATAPTFTLPPNQDVDQKVSIVFALDFSPSVTAVALTALQSSIMQFIADMRDGDYAAIVKFNAANPERATVVQPFTEISPAGRSALEGALMAPYPGTGSNITNLFEGVELSIEQFTSPLVTLPAGPKAVLLVSDGEENASQGINFEGLKTLANQAGVSIFTIGVGTVKTGTPLTIMTELARDTGGDYLPAPTDTEIADAYLSISTLLNNEYLLTFNSSISDCNSHNISVQVTGQATPGTSTFTRCTAAPPPPPPPATGGGGGGGGGGSTGLLELMLGLGLLGARRRLCRSN